MSYAAVIRRYSKLEPRLVEAAMRSRYGVLDHLSAADFRREAKIAEAMYAADPDLMERLADSFGLTKEVK